MKALYSSFIAIAGILIMACTTTENNKNTSAINYEASNNYPYRRNIAMNDIYKYRIFRDVYTGTGD
jgi:hypothetical protein